MQRDYFSSLLNCPRPVAPAVWNQLADMVPDEAHPMSVDAPSKAEVEAAVKKLKITKHLGCVVSFLR